MAKTQTSKRIVPKIILIIVLCQICGFYALFIWGKNSINKPISYPIVYQGIWIEDTKKIGDFWSVGYLKVNKQ